MGHCNRLSRATRRGVLGACAALLIAWTGTAARADTEAPRDYNTNADTLGTPEPAESEGPNKGRVHLTFGNDFTTAYFFRGILQERNGFIYEPYGELTLNLWAGDGILNRVDAGMGVWLSLQTEKTGFSGNGPGNLFETDYY